MITYTSYEDVYLFLIHEIIEQMLTVKTGAAIFERLNTLCNNCITPETIIALSDDEIKSIRTSNAKVTYIKSVTEAFNTGVLNFKELCSFSDEEVIKKLMSIRGIGKLNAKMYLIFVLQRCTLPLSCFRYRTNQE